MATERARVSALATWVGGQLKTLGKTLRYNGATLTPKWWVASTVTTGGGVVSVAVPAGEFTAVIAAWVIPVRNSTDPTQAVFGQVRTRTAATVTGIVWESKTTNTLLLSTAEGVEPAPSGLAVDVVVLGY